MRRDLLVITMVVAVTAVAAAGQQVSPKSLATCGGEDAKSTVLVVVDAGLTSGTATLKNYSDQYVGRLKHTHALSTNADGGVTWKMWLENSSPCKVLVDWVEYDAAADGEDDTPLCCIETPKELRPWESWSGTRPINVPRSAHGRVSITVTASP